MQFSELSSSRPGPWSGPGKAVGVLYLVALAAFVLVPATVEGQATDEVWTLPAFYVPNGGSATGGCGFFLNRDIRTGELMDSLLSTHEWPTANQRLVGFSFLQNLMIENASCTVFFPADSVADP
ncbi:MAG: hypothetical protein AAFY88_01420, partial [Acidobacteriota bacterium]